MAFDHYFTAMISALAVHGPSPDLPPGQSLLVRIHRESDVCSIRHLVLVSTTVSFKVALVAIMSHGVLLLSHPASPFGYAIRLAMPLRHLAADCISFQIPEGDQMICMLGINAECRLERPDMLSAQPFFLTTDLCLGTKPGGAASSGQGHGQEAIKSCDCSLGCSCNSRSALGAAVDWDCPCSSRCR